MEDFTEVFVWGSDHFGQLGLGSKQHNTYSLPRFCSFNILIRSISCGDQHSGFVSSSGHVYTMGSNIDGRLGIGDPTTKFSSSPCLVESLTSQNILNISCGGGHSIVTNSEGLISSWGYGENGALGLGNTQNQFVPVSIRLPVGVQVLQTTCGAKHSALIVRSNTGNIVYVCGNGESGQLGTGKREKELQFVQVKAPEEITQASCGVFHSGFISVTGKIYTTGGNSFGQLGLGNKKGTCILRKVESVENVKMRKIVCASNSAALAENGDVYVWGAGPLEEYLAPFRITTSATDISLGGNFLIVLKEELGIYSWGNNSHGELGLGDYDPRDSPGVISSLQGKNITKVTCGNSFVIALGDDVRYNSSKKKTNFPTRTTEKFEIEDREKNSIDKMIMKRNIMDRSTLEKGISNGMRNDDGELRRNSENMRNELGSCREEIRRLMDALAFEQAKNRNFDEDGRRESVGQSQFLEMHRLKMHIEEAKHQVYGLEIDNKSVKEENTRLQNLMRQREIEFAHELESKLENTKFNLTEQHKIEISSVVYEVDQGKMQIKQLETSLSLSNSHKSRLEDSLFSLDSQTKDLKFQLDQTRQQLSSVEREKAQKHEEFENLLNESESFRLETAKKDSDREHMVRLIECKIQELEHDRSSLAKERDMLNSALTDMTYELNRSNQLSSEYSQTISSLTMQLSSERENNSNLQIDLETAKEEILILELKNNEIFENLQRELSQRAKEYKERTLNLLNTPSRPKSPLRESSNLSPQREPINRSSGYYSNGTMPTIDLIPKTEKKSAYPSRSQQEKINAAALKLMQRTESPLRNIRVSSPCRNSPERPSPYKSSIKCTPDSKFRNIYFA